jgi:hypothetical protein
MGDTPLAVNDDNDDVFIVVGVAITALLYRASPRIFYRK